MKSPRVPRDRLGALVLVCALWACAPALDWREVRPQGTQLTLMLPCRPSTFARRVKLADTPVELSMFACVADDLTWGLAHASLSDPAQVGPVLHALRQAAASNFSAPAARGLALSIPGATPNAQASRVELSGRRPDGKPVQAQVAVFARGMQVFQATVVGRQIPADASEVFFSSIRFRL